MGALKMSDLLKIHEIRLLNARKIMKDSGLDRTQFAEKIGMSYNLLSQYIGKNPKKNIGDDTAEKIENAFSKPKGFLDQANQLNSIKDQHFQIVDTWDSETPLGDDEVEIPYFEDFSFACGSGSIGEALESETSKLRMSKSVLRNLTIDKKNAVATRASGDSMNPTIKDGDTIHIDLGRKTIKDGKIFAICHGDLFYAKRLYNLPLGGVRIVSDNSAEFPEMRITAQEIIDQKFEIIGWIWQISSIESW